MNLDSIIHSSSPHPRASILLKSSQSSRYSDAESSIPVRPSQNGPLPSLAEDLTYNHHSSSASEMSASTVSSPVSDESYSSSDSFPVTFHPGQQLMEKKRSKKSSRSVVDEDHSIDASTIEKGSRKRRAAFPADTSGMSAAEIKRERRKQQNRDAAATSRMKKKMYVENMNSRIANLSEATQKLQVRLQQLAEENSQLKKLLKAKQEEIYGQDGAVTQVHPEIPVDPVHQLVATTLQEELIPQPVFDDIQATQTEQYGELSTPQPQTHLSSHASDSSSQSSSPYDDSQHTSPVNQWYSSGSDGEEADIIVRQNEIFVSSPQSSETSYSSHEEAHYQVPSVVLRTHTPSSLEPLRVTTVSSVSSIHSESQPRSYVAATPVPLPSLRNMDTRQSSHTFSYSNNTTQTFSDSTSNTYEHVVSSSSSSSLSSSSSSLGVTVSSSMLSSSSTDLLTRSMISPSSTNVHTANMQYSMPCSGLCMKVQELIIMLVINQMNMMILPWSMYLTLVSNMMMVNSTNKNSNQHLSNLLMNLYQQNNLNSSMPTASTSSTDIKSTQTETSSCHTNHSSKLLEEHLTWHRSSTMLLT